MIFALAVAVDAFYRAKLHVGTNKKNQYLHRSDMNRLSVEIFKAFQ